MTFNFGVWSRGFWTSVFTKQHWLAEIWLHSGPTPHFGRIPGENSLIVIDARDQLFILDGYPKPTHWLWWVPGTIFLTWMYAQGQFLGLDWCAGSIPWFSKHPIFIGCTPPIYMPCRCLQPPSHRKLSSALCSPLSSNSAHFCLLVVKHRGTFDPSARCCRHFRAAGSNFNIN